MKAKSAILASVAAVGIASTAGAQTFNGGAITINAFGIANPYPATINVAGLPTSFASMTVTLTNINHTYSDDMGAVLVGPNGGKVILFDGPGSGATLNGAWTWTFDDAAAATLPTTGAMASGTFKPGQNQYSDVFSAPAPAGPYATSFSTAFGGSNPNGTWSLYIQDFVGGDGGSVASWSITFTQVPAPGAMALLGLAGVVGGRRRRLA